MTVKTRAELKAENSADFPNNVTRLISPADLRGQMDDVTDSMLMDEDIAGLDLSEANVTAEGAGTKTLAEWTADTLDGDGVSQFLPPWEGAISWPVTTRMQQQVYLLDFIPLAVHPHILDGTAATAGHANFYDCSDAIDAAMASITQDFGPNYDGGPEIIFSHGWFYFSRTIEMKKIMTFTGHGQGARNGYGTTLKFAADITGITVNCLTGYDGSMVPGTVGADGSTIRHLRLESANAGVPNPALNSTGHGPGNGVGHGIWVRGQANIEHCSIQWFPQNGIYVRATAQIAGSPGEEGASIFGNANCTYVAHVACLSNGGCGLYIEGSDTNSSRYIGMDFGSNRLSAIRDSSLINSTHIAPQANSNGIAYAFCSYATVPGVTQTASYYCKDEWRANDSAVTWTVSTRFYERQYVRNVGNLYRNINSGAAISGTGGGPTGTGTNIIDGACRWAYVSADAGMRVPPTGHAQSSAVWEFIANHPGPVGSIGVDANYPMFPNLIDGVTPKTYRFSPVYHFDQGSVLLIWPYSEEGQVPTHMAGASLIIGALPLTPESVGGMLHAGTTGTTSIRHGLEVPSKRDTTDNARNFLTGISRIASEALSFQTATTPTGSAASGNALAWVWDELTGCWYVQYARNVAKVAQVFTTDVNKQTAGRAAPIPSGATMFNQGMWLGSRFHNMVTAAPTSGEYAAGDVLFNQTPTGVSAPSGWICTTGGAVTATAWVAFTTYAVGDIRLNDGGKAYVCINSGKAFGTATAWAADTVYTLNAMHTNDGGKAYLCIGIGTSAGNPAWAPSTAYTLGQISINSGESYRCIVAGTSAASGGPTGTSLNILDGTVHWGWIATTSATGPAGTGFAIADGTAVWDHLSLTTGAAHPWAQSTYYGVNDTVINGGVFLICNNNGTSAATGTGPVASGVDGTINWTLIVPTAMATTGPAGTGSYILDGTAAWSYKAPFVMTPFDGKLSQQTISDGLVFTLTPGSSPRNTLYTGTMTADRAVTLAVSPVPVAGSYFRITRTATGAFNLNVGTGPLKALAVNTWCEVTYSGSAWYLSSYGTL